MLRNEAAWLRKQLEAVPDDELSPLLSIGSGTDLSRSRQPWIDQLVFAPLRCRGVDVIHHEHSAGPGIDLAGDLGDGAFLHRLGDLGARSLLCANVLEHVADPRPVAAALAEALPAGGRLLVTVPRRYPYHPDPIDTMLRPTPTELTELFPSLTVLAAEEVACESLLRYMLAVRGKRMMVVNGVRALAERSRSRNGQQSEAAPDGAEGVLRYVVRATSATCAVFGAGRPGTTASRAV